MSGKHRRPRAEVRAEAERLAKVYVEQIRQGKPPLSLAGRSPVEKRRILEEEEKVFHELEEAGLPTIRRTKRSRKTNDSNTEASKPKSRKPKTPKVKVSEEAEELLRREAELNVREEAIKRREIELKWRKRDTEETIRTKLSRAQATADAIVEKARDIERQAKETLEKARAATPEEKARAEANAEVVQARQEAARIRQENLAHEGEGKRKAEEIVAKAEAEAAEIRAESAALKAFNTDLAQTMSLPEAEARRFMALLSNPPLSREAINQRMALYSDIYKNSESHTSGISERGFMLRRSNHVQDIEKYSIKWAISDGKLPLAMPEAEAILRILVSQLAAQEFPRSGVFELAFMDAETKKMKDILRVLLPGGKIYLDYHKSRLDHIVGWSMAHAINEMREKYSEKTGWHGGINGKYRFGRLAVRSGCFIFSFAGAYEEAVEKTAVLALLIGIATALAQLAFARGELKTPLSEFPKRPTLNAAITSVNRQFDELVFPEIQAWNAWCQSFKPKKWQFV